MQTGRPPKPLSLRIAEGDTRQRGANKHAEAVANTWNAERGIPEMPLALRPRKKDNPQTRRLLRTARECWDYLAPIMADEKLLATVDGVSMTTLCFAYAGYVEAMRDLSFDEANRLMGRAIQCADRMGLNESARARLQLTRPKEKGPDPILGQMTAFLKARKPA